MTHLARQKDTSWSKEKRVDTVESVHCIEPLEENCGAGNHLEQERLDLRYLCNRQLPAAST